MEHSISKYLKKYRKITGMTQQQFALKAGVGLRFLRDIEQEVPNQTVDKINQVLGMFGGKLGVVTENENNNNGNYSGRSIGLH